MRFARHCLGTVLICCIAGAAATVSIADSGLSGLRDELDAAVNRGDETALQNLATRLESQDGSLADYYRAYAHYRLGELTADREKLAKGHLNDCIDILKDVVSADPGFAEAQALQATCYGVSAPFYMLRAATRGIAANNALARALEADAGNPRVILADGISLYFRPSAFGGDKARAQTRLQEAIGRYAEFRPATADSPVWGEAEAWLYLARIQRDAGETSQARDSLDRALKLAPGYAEALKESASLAPPSG